MLLAVPAGGALACSVIAAGADDFARRAIAPGTPAGIEPDEDNLSICFTLC
jgi:hypothetical protein